MPLSFIQPALGGAFAGFSEATGDQQSNIVIVGVLFCVVRLLVWFYMHRVIWAAKAAERSAVSTVEEGQDGDALESAAGGAVTHTFKM